MNKEVILPSGNYLFVEVPNKDTIKYFWLCDRNRSLAYKEINELCIYSNLIPETYWTSQNKHSINYKIISTTNDITEKQCESIVGKKFGDGYYEFVKPGMMRVASMKHSFPFDTAKESLHSLIQANNLNIENNYLIIKKIMKTVVAEEIISYVCNCPYCEETILSEYQDDWDIAENQEYDQVLKCEECEKEFIVTLP